MADNLSNRLGLLKREDLRDAEQKEIHDRLIARGDSVSDGSFQFKDSQDRLIGPFPLLLHNPSIAKPFLGFAEALTGLPGNFPAKCKEIAILRVGARYNAAYELYAHRILGEREGLTKDEAANISKGEYPESLGKKDDSRDTRVAFDVAAALVDEKGPLREELYRAAEERFGKDGVRKLIYYCSFYSQVCVMLNGFDVKAPSKL